MICFESNNPEFCISCYCQKMKILIQFKVKRPSLQRTILHIVLTQIVELCNNLKRTSGTNFDITNYCHSYTEMLSMVRVGLQCDGINEKCFVVLDDSGR